MTPPRARLRLRSLLVAGATLAAATAVTAAPAVATYAGPKAQNGRIAFVRGGDIYAIYADGTQRLQITTNAALDRDPAWAPDGRNMAFARQQNGQWDIWIIVPDGSRPVQVTGTNAYDEVQPTFSPDGRRLTYVRIDRTDPARTELVSADRTGADPSVLGLGATPDWSSGGIAFAPLDGGPLQLTRDRSTDRESLESTGFAAGDVEAAPSWSPDGKAVAFQRRTPGAAPEVRILTRATGASRPVIGSAADPSWSPNSQFIAFERDGQIWTVDKNTLATRQVTTDPADSFSPAWQPEPAQPIVAPPPPDDPDPLPNPGAPPPPLPRQPPPIVNPPSPTPVVPAPPAPAPVPEQPRATPPPDGRIDKRVPPRPPKPRLLAVSYPHRVALGARVRINARFDRRVTFQYLVMRLDRGRMVRVNGAKARGREITASYTPSRRGRYLVKLTFTAGGVKAVRTIRVRVT